MNNMAANTFQVVGTRIGACRSAVAVPVAGRRWLWSLRYKITLMKKIMTLFTILLATAYARAGELQVSSTDPIFVTVPDHWQAAKYSPPDHPSPAETYRIVPPDSRNAAVLFSLFDKSTPEFSDPEFLKKTLRGTFVVYVASPVDLPKIPIKELNIKGGLGYYASFVDPDLVGKPVEKGNYKISTSAIVGLGSKYLIVITVLCDQINGADYRDAINIVESIKVKKD
jgi:hypothetical protein